MLFRGGTSYAFEYSMPVVVVHYPDGQEELALVSETLFEPTVQLVDTHGDDFMARLAQCRPANAEEEKSYWKLRAHHSAGQAE